MSSVEKTLVDNIHTHLDPLLGKEKVTQLVSTIVKIETKTPQYVVTLEEGERELKLLSISFEEWGLKKEELTRYNFREVRAAHPGKTPEQVLVLFEERNEHRDHALSSLQRLCTHKWEYIRSHPKYRELQEREESRST